VRRNALTAVLVVLLFGWGGLLVRLERLARAEPDPAPVPSWSCPGFLFVVGDLAAPGLRCPHDGEGEDALLARLGVGGCTAQGGDGAAGADDGRDRLLLVQASGSGREGCSLVRQPLPAAWLLALGLPLDVNRSSAAELEVVPGIGPALARRIVEARRIGGPFGRIEELQRVKGVGPLSLRRLQHHLEVRP